MKVDQSRLLYERACRVVPGGIHSNIRKGWRPVPMFYERGQGSHVWDVDGNEYIDYILGQGPLLLGHSPKPVIEAVQRQVERGLIFAAQTVIELEAAEKLLQLVPCGEMVRFTTSGSEAVQYALRLARGVTGRTKIMRFEGHYHGWIDNIFWSSPPVLEQAGPREKPVPVPSTRGQAPSDAQNLMVLPWNDLDLVRRVFEQSPEQIAAVITEPIMYNNGGIMPRPGFLEGLRDLCTKYGALLIFDEIITGFRVALGGAQELFGVTPDLATYAKAMAAGFPVSALAGRRELMQPFGDLSIVHAGTYNSNPPCMAATVAALDMLAANEGALLKHAHNIGTQLMEGIRDIGRKAGQKVSVRGHPSLFFVAFDEPREPVDYRTFAAHCNTEKYNRFLWALQERGLRVPLRGIWFVSTAHTQEDVDKTLAAVADALREI